jgi:hypothetical protein
MFNIFSHCNDYLNLAILHICQDCIQLKYFEENNIEETEEAGKENYLQISCLNQSETIYIQTKIINNIVDLKYNKLYI